MRASVVGDYAGTLPIKARKCAIKWFQRLLLYASNCLMVTFSTKASDSEWESHCVYLSAHMAFFFTGRAVRSLRSLLSGYQQICPSRGNAMQVRWWHFGMCGTTRQGAQVTANAGTCATYDIWGGD
jgi:hypothetical protein